jgi:cytochrome c biogenesis protein CcdA
MANVFAQMAGYGLAAAGAAPLALVISCLILAQSKRPILSVWIFSAGAAVLAIAVLVIVAIVFGESDSAVRHDLSAILGILLGAIFLVLGVIPIFQHETPERETKRQQQAANVASSAPPRMFLMGALLQVINFDAIAVFGVGVKQVAVADVSTGRAAAAFVVGLALMLVFYYGPAIIYVLVRARAEPALRAMSQWLIRHARPLEIVAGIVIGAFFLWHGIADLL